MRMLWSRTAVNAFAYVRSSRTRNSLMSCLRCSGVAWRQARPTDSAVMRSKFTCGISVVSTSSLTRLRSPAWISLSDLSCWITFSDKSSMNLFGSCCAIAADVPAANATTAVTRTATRWRNFRFMTLPDRSRPQPERRRRHCRHYPTRTFRFVARVQQTTTQGRRETASLPARVRAAFGTSGRIFRSAPTSGRFLGLQVLLVPGIIVIRIGIVRRVAVVHRLATPLQPPVSNEGIAIQRRAFHDAFGIEQVGPAAHDVEAEERVANAHRRVRPVQRVALGVDEARWRVTEGGRPEERKHQVGSARHAPPAQRLAEVLVVAPQADVGRDIRHAAEAEGGVDHHSGQVDQR